MDSFILAIIGLVAVLVIASIFLTRKLNTQENRTS